MTENKSASNPEFIPRPQHTSTAERPSSGDLQHSIDSLTNERPVAVQQAQELPLQPGQTVAQQWGEIPD
ncbi:hypothetical protein DVG80_21255 [Rhodococcus erythropolis]|nr:hypothetical protein DVG80_21255 [Rhodococcus erythropolis]